MRDDPTPRTDRPPGGVDIPLPGIQTARDMESAEEHYLEPDADPESNELHAGGKMCARCRRIIGPDDEVRRTLAGKYQHEVCPS